MDRLAHITMTATLAAMATIALPPIPPVHAQQLAYRLPSPATATYHLVDSTTASMVTIGGAESLGAHTALSYALTFQADDAGVRVTGELTAFAAAASEPFGGTTAFTREQAGMRDFALVLGPSGVAEVASPSLAADSDLPILVHPHTVFFPRLPDSQVEAGGTWVDTVMTALGGGGETSKVVAYTYTVAGEETVDGRSYLRVDVSGEGTMIEAGDEGTLTGGENGYFLWDTERGLMAVLEISRSFEGSVPGPGGSMSLTFVATTRVALEN